MTNKEIAERLVNESRGGYRPCEVIALIVRGIEMAKEEERKVLLRDLEQDTVSVRGLRHCRVKINTGVYQ